MKTKTIKKQEIFKNEWLDAEVTTIKREAKEKMNDRESMKLFYKFLAMLIVLLFLTLKVFAEPIEVSNGCNVAGWFPNTWKCSNHACGYENYEGIEYCALCGKRR